MNFLFRHHWTLPHIAALACILMCAVVALSFLYSELPLYYFSILPYCLLVLPFHPVSLYPDAIPSLSGWYIFVIGLTILLIYSFFFALVATFVRKQKVVPLTYVCLYITLTVIFGVYFEYLL